MHESELSLERMFVSFGLAHCGVGVEAQIPKLWGAWT